MVGISGVTLTKLLYLSVSIHFPPALGLCPTADLAADPLRVVTPMILYLGPKYLMEGEYVVLFSL